MEEDKTIYKDFLQPRDAWDALSMKEKAEMIGVAVRNGITNLNDIREKYNEFAEGGSKEEVVNTDEQYLTTMEKVAKDNHQKWGFSNPDEALLHALNDNTYNYRGYYDKYPQSKANADTHWTDEFKIVYHPTFSNESIYSGQKSQYNPLGLPGGFWSGDTFVPMAWQLDANEYKKGGSIHIKPSHRGRLTELKKRTGKTEAELYRTGGPAVRKMITFARNSRKWRHGFGGNLFAPGGDTKASDYRYVLDDDGEWNRVANDEMGRVFQGLTVTPAGGNSQPAPARYRISYDAGVTKDNAAPIRNLFSKIQEVADTPIMVQANPGTATGYSSFGQYMPKSQSTYGDQANLLLTELTSPTVLSDAKGIYQVLRHPIQTAKAIRSVFSEGTPAAEWAGVNNSTQAVDLLNKGKGSNNSLFVEMPLSKREEATNRMMEFIYGKDYQRRLQDAGLRDNWKVISEYIENRINGKDYFPAKEWSIIDNNPERVGSSNVSKKFDDYGVNIKQGISEEDFRQAIDHELAHWSTGNLKSNGLFNSMYSQIHGVPNSKEIGKIMEYNKSLANNRSWEEFRKEFLPKSTPQKVLSQWKKHFDYINDIQERRANAYAMMQEAKRQGLTIDQFVDKYLKNDKVASGTPEQLEYLSYIYKPEELKKFMKGFLSVTAPVTIGTNINK